MKNPLLQKMKVRVAQYLGTTAKVLDHMGFEKQDIMELHSFFFGGQQTKG